MSIKIKLLLSSLLTILGIVAVALVGLVSLDQTKANIIQLTSQSAPLQVRTLEFQQVTEQLMADLLKLSMAISADELKRSSQAIDARLQNMEGARKAIQALNPSSRLDIEPFRLAARNTADVVSQRLKELNLFQGEAAEINQVLKKIEESIQQASNEMSGLSAQAVKGVSEAQQSGSRVNASVKKVLTIQARLKDVELTINNIDSIQNRFRLTPVRERLKGVIDSIQAVKSDPDDPPLVKEIKETAQTIHTNVIRDGTGLLALRAQVLSGKDAESRRDGDGQYAALKKVISTSLEALNTKVSEFIDPLEFLLAREKQKIERAIDFQTRAAVALTLGNAIAVDAKEIKAHIRLMMLTESDKDLQEVTAGVAAVTSRMRDNAEKLRTSLRDSGQSRLAAIAAQSAALIEKSTEALLGISAARGRVLANDGRMNELLTRIKALVAEQSRQGEARVKDTAQNQQQMVSGVNEGVRSAIETMLAISSILVVLTIVMSIVIMRSVTKPLGLMSDSVLEIERQGDLSRQISLKGRDEVGQTVAAFNTLMKSMHTSFIEIDRVMSAVAQNDLTQRVDGSAAGDFQRLKQSVNSSIQMLAETLRLISENTQGVAVAAVQTNESIGQIADGSQAQLSAVAQLARVIGASGAAMAEMARNAEATFASARASSMIVKSGRSKMSAMVDVAEKISGNSTRINKISVLIGSIASQTNLLSLNAAIEAARAGEAGRGFAVVADEIGKLAHTVSDSVNEISSLVRQAIEDSDQAVRMAQEANEEMEKIEHSSTQSEALLLGISDAVKQQHAAMREIETNIKTVDTIAGQNASASRQITATSAALSELAATSKRLIERFAVSGRMAPVT